MKPTQTLVETDIDGRFLFPPAPKKSSGFPGMSGAIFLRS